MGAGRGLPCRRPPKGASSTFSARLPLLLARSPPPCLPWPAAGPGGCPGGAGAVRALPRPGRALLAGTAGSAGARSGQVVPPGDAGRARGRGRAGAESRRADRCTLRTRRGVLRRGLFLAGCLLVACVQITKMFVISGQSNEVNP